MVQAQVIKDDWNNQKCNPKVIPFAGFINKPDDKSAIQFTGDNFTGCVQSILENIVGYALAPFQYIISGITDLYNDLSKAVATARSFLAQLRSNFSKIGEDILSRILNILTPLQQIMITFASSMGKTQAVLTAGLYTSLGTYYALKSLLGALFQVIIIIFIVVTVIITLLFIAGMFSPFIWTAAFAALSSYIAITTVFAIVAVFFVQVLQVHVQMAPKAPTPPSACFDPNTELSMNDGSKKPIKDIQVGDVLENNNIVTTKVKVLTKDHQMFSLNNVIVSESHIVKYKDKWIPVSKHPDRIKIDSYAEPYLYCLNTSSKTIVINDLVFTDWDEIYGNDLKDILNLPFIKKTENIHKYLNGGFSGETKLILENGAETNIKDVEPGSKLNTGEKIYGVVEIDAINIGNIKEYNLGYFNNSYTGKNICLCDKNMTKLSKIEGINAQESFKKLYHILTDTSTFTINNLKFCDYNSLINLHLGKDNDK